MKALFWIGMVVLIVGIASLFVPIPHIQREGFKAGDVSVGIETRHEDKVSPYMSAAIILGGAGMMVVGRTRS